MIYLILVISLSNLMLGAFSYKKIRESNNPVVFNTYNIVEHLEPEPEPEVAAPPLVTVQMVEDVYHGWKNQSNIPWVEPIRSPALATEALTRGPLARPDGFI